jgi:cytochrome c553
MKIQKSWTKAVILALGVMPSFAWAQKNWNAPPIATTYCSGCHGIDGNSQLPYFPKLGGLDATYAEKKLTEFKEPPSPPVDEMFWWLAKVAGGKKNTSNATQAERVNMEGVAHAANPEIIKEAVLWYAKQAPAPGHSSNESLIVAGKDLFLHGIPAQKILACTTCHGADA